MNLSESGFRRFSEFQPNPGYRELERSPFQVITQTDILIRLFSQGLINDPTLGAKYLHGYTFPFLDDAQTGSQSLFNRYGGLDRTATLELEEAADHAFVVFAWMHRYFPSQFLPDGFSRQGMLKAPLTKEEFEERIQELQNQLFLLSTGQTGHYHFIEEDPSLLRTYAFFHTGRNLPLHFPETEEEREKRTVERLLKGLDINL